MNYAPSKYSPLEKPYDLCFIEQACRGNQESMRAMILTFLSTTQLAVREIQAAHQRHDLESIRRTAHRVKPTFSMYGMERLAALLQSIEEMAIQGSGHPSLPTYIDSLVAQFERIVPSIQNEYSIH